MTIKVGINGIGRIGKTILRSWLDSGTKDIEVRLINDLMDPKSIAHLIKYDSVHGRATQNISADGDALVIDGKKIKISAVKNPAEIPWGEAGVDIVLECTGFFTDRDKAAGHLKGGAKKVIISAPAKNPDATIVMGINEKNYNPKLHAVISNASCTTNCLAPVAKVLNEKFKIRHGMMTTVHSYTNDQQILDKWHPDLRRARAGGLSQIPTTTGAAKAIGEVLPELKGKLDGLAIRVPTPNVSLIDLVCEVEAEVDVKTVNDAFIAAEQGGLKGILATSAEPLVSSDFNGRRESSIIDLPSTNVIDKHLVKVLSWYDNETGFSHRMVDLTRYVGERLS